ncbi:MAG TPA: biotin/lipoyl-containing protein [Ktedonobacteraceae bacterium]|nr:biotin/lipoyl-containing protein [Ktedonobacteraceae bacterium]
MEIQEHETPWLRRVEDLINVLEGSTVGELELTEAGTRIVIRRRPDMMMVSIPAGQVAHAAGALPVAPARAEKEDRSVAIASPLTGVYYAAPSPNDPPFVTPGSFVAVGQVIALVEAMKVFNEVQADVAGRVREMVAINGEVVQKGDALLKVEPM